MHNDSTFKELQEDLPVIVGFRNVLDKVSPAHLDTWNNCSWASRLILRVCTAFFGLHAFSFFPTSGYFEEKAVNLYFMNLSISHYNPKLIWDFPDPNDSKYRQVIRQTYHHICHKLLRKYRILFALDRLVGNTLSSEVQGITLLRIKCGSSESTICAAIRKQWLFCRMYLVPVLWPPHYIPALQWGTNAIQYKCFWIGETYLIVPIIRKNLRNNPFR